MIEYQRDQQQTIPDSQVKIVGVGGAGLNMIDRITLNGLAGVELLALASNARALMSSVVSEKVQLGVNLTMGLGCGGDPELGLRVAKEQETEIRDSLRDRKMVFICVGLGGGTGSGAAPLVARIAREMGAFVVVFATMPFEFEGKRRREQAESALNELSVISNALVTFENARMGELVLAAQGIHEAFEAANHMIGDSIQAVTRLVVRPGLINVGLDDLMRSLNATRSRCLFGSGIAQGENRSHAALQSALTSPLLEKGRLLKETKNVLVHVCGGESMTLFEVELLMRELSKHIPEDAHVMFGAAADDSMGDSLSVTLISSLPEEALNPEKQPVAVVEPSVLEEEKAVEEKVVEAAPAVAPQEPEESKPEGEIEVVAEGNLLDKLTEMAEEIELGAVTAEVESEVVELPELAIEESVEPVVEEQEELLSEPELEVEEEVTEKADESAEESAEFDEMAMFEELEKEVAGDLIEDAMKSKAVSKGAQAELELDGGPRGKFTGEAPNLIDGEDLDIPPYLRNKK